MENIRKVATISLILTLTIAALVTLLPTVNAANIPTYAFLSAAPNPVGVNQEVTIMMWLDKIDPTASGPQGSRFGGFTVTITKPNGDQETKGPFTSDPASFAYTLYVPDQIGTYTLEFNFPGQQVTGIGGLVPLPIDDYFEPSSFTTTLTVQEDPILSLPQTPLPTYYWTRPIDAQNRAWHTISGNWLMEHYDKTLSYGLGGGGFNPYTTAPNSSHIVWTKPMTYGGLIGGSYGSSGTSNYYTGQSYEHKFLPPVIMNGVLYYNTPVEAPVYGFYAVDLRTGQTIWWQNSTGQPPQPISLVGISNEGVRYNGITLGQIYNYISPNQFGGFPYLWSLGGTPLSGYCGVWSMYDAVTGDWILNFANATSTTSLMFAPDGSLLEYILGSNWLAMWNSSKAIGSLSTFSTGAWAWRPPTGATLDWRDGLEWNVTTSVYPGQAIVGIDSDTGIILATTGNMIMPQNWQWEIGYDMKTGEQLWVQNRTTPIGNTNWALMGPIGEGVYTEFYFSTMQWSGFSLTTGEKLWGPTEPYKNAWGMYTTPQINSLIAYGKLYASGYDGIIHCYDVKTGQHLWDYSTGSSGLETACGVWPFSHNSPMVIADGKLYEATGVSHGDPQFRGAKLYCIDTNTGNPIWNISMWGESSAIADGYLVIANGYDNQIYCFGKGQTETTVTGPENVQPLGGKVLIKGTVTDQSPGAEGTPAISDEDMTAWMEYMYMQQPCPENAEGVEVVLTTYDPNGNTYEIGRTTTDMSGTFGIEVDPPVPGLYKIIATFEGSESYYGSSAVTYVSVEEAPVAAQPIEPEPTELGSTEPISTATESTGAFALGTTEVAIIAAVAVAVIIGIATYWTLKKRK